MQRRGGGSKPTHFNIAQAARMAGLSETLLSLWVETGRFEPSLEVPPLPLPDPSHPLHKIVSRDHAKTFEKTFIFTNTDIARLQKMVEGNASAREKTATAHVKGSHYTVQELATLWGLGVDKIRELFEDEQGVIKIQRPRKRGRRAYVTLRIPENVAERVQRRTSNA